MKEPVSIDNAIQVVDTTSLLIIRKMSGSYFSQRNLDILSLYIQHVDVSEISRRYNLSVRRIFQVLEQTLSKMKKLQDNYYARAQELQAELDDARRLIATMRYGKEKVRKSRDLSSKVGVLLEDCGISNRTLRALRLAYPDVDTVIELSRLTKSAIVSSKGLGRKSVAELEDILANYHLHFQ